MPSTRRGRPGGRRAATRSTISRRTATTTTRVRGPAGVSTEPSGLHVEHGLVDRHRDVIRREQRGRPRSSAFSSSISGRSRVRTTMRWLAMPRRTRLGRSCSSKSARSVSAEGGRRRSRRRRAGRRGAGARPRRARGSASRWRGPRRRPHGRGRARGRRRWVLDARFLLNTSDVSARARGRLRRLTTKRAPEGPLRRYVGAGWDYQLPSAVQPPLSAVVQVRVTTPAVFLMVYLFVFAPLDVDRDLVAGRA